MANIQMQMEFARDLDAPLLVQTPVTLLKEGDSEANVLVIRLYRGKEEADVSGSAVSGYLLRADGVRVPLTGSVNGNTVTVDMDEHCYLVPGPYGAFVRLVSGGIKRTVLEIAGEIKSEGDGPVVDTGEKLITLDDIIAQMNKMQQVTEETENAADAANTAASAANTAAGTANAAAAKANTAASTANTATSRANAAAETLEEAPVPTGTVVTYQVGTSAATPPTGTWLTNVPSVPQGQFLWTRIVQSFTNGSPVAYYSVARQGMDGSGSVSSVNGVVADANGDVAVRKVFEEGGNDYITFAASANGVRITESVYGSYLYFRSDGATGNGNVTVRDVDGNVINHLYGTANKPAAADVGALAVDGTAVNASKLGGKAPEYYIQPRNLLDNSYFERISEIVNQRGQTSYSTSVSGHVYFIDRWKHNGKMTASLTSNGLQLKNDTTEGRRGVYQALTDKSLIGKTLTFAICLSDGTVYTTTSTVSATSDSYTQRLIFGDDNFIAVYNYQGYPGAIIAIGPSVTLTLKWAALYEGSYTAETLPPYVSKGYGAELAECLRYYCQSSGGAGNYADAVLIRAANVNWLCSVPFGIPMRDTPTVTIYGGTSGAVGAVTDWASDEDAATDVTVQASSRGFLISKTGAFEADKAYYFKYTASAEL